MERSDLAGIGLDIEPIKQVERLAKLTQSSGLDGVVCSAREVALIREICGKDFLTVTPGIRPQGSDVGDQKRVMTPRQAVEAGVDYMVIGRPITRAPAASEACAEIIRLLS
jgi:orotidine-5'-phosphate decarboxylase